MPSLTPTQARTTLVALRGALGASWIAPLTLAKTFGLGSTDEPTLPYLIRLFAARDAALAFLTAVTRGETQRTVLKVGVAVDALDAVAGAIAGVSGKTPPVPAVLATGTAAAAAGLGVLALQG